MDNILEITDLVTEENSIEKILMDCIRLDDIGSWNEDGKIPVWVHQVGEYLGDRSASSVQSWAWKRLVLYYKERYDQESDLRYSEEYGRQLEN